MEKLQIHKIEQRSWEWHETKAGKISASASKAIEFKEPVFYAKSNKDNPGGLRSLGGWTDGSKTYARKLAAERIFGADEDETFVSHAMQRGIDLEPEAREAYQAATGKTVVEIGGFQRGNFWYSPDGLVGDDGLIEIKCPGRSRHLEVMLSGEVPADNLQQCLFALWITGRQYIDFVSFNPDLKREGIDKRLKIIRLQRATYLTEIMAFDDLFNRFDTFVGEIVKSLTS